MSVRMGYCPVSALSPDYQSEFRLDTREGRARCVGIIHPILSHSFPLISHDQSVLLFQFDTPFHQPVRYLHPFSLSPLEKKLK